MYFYIYSSSEQEDNATTTTTKKTKAHRKSHDHVKPKHGKRIKVMPLQNSFSTTDTEDSDGADISPRTEKISPQKPRRLRMMERSKKRWHRMYNSQSQKATVSVQLDDVKEIMDFGTYLATLEEEQKEDTDTESTATNKSPCASGSKENELSPSACPKDKKYRRIKLFDSSTSSSETESENDKIHKRRKHKKRHSEEKQAEEGEVEETVWTPFTYRSFDHSKARSGSSESSRSEYHSCKKQVGKEHYKNSSSHEKYGKERHSSSHHHRHKKTPSIDESHHSRHSKERSHSVSASSR